MMEGAVYPGYTRIMCVWRARLDWFNVLLLIGLMVTVPISCFLVSLYVTPNLNVFWRCSCCPYLLMSYVSALRVAKVSASWLGQRYWCVAVWPIIHIAEVSLLHGNIVDQDCLSCSTGLICQRVSPISLVLAVVVLSSQHGEKRLCLHDSIVWCKWWVEETSRRNHGRVC